MKQFTILAVLCLLLGATALQAQDYDGSLAMLTEWTIAQGTAPDFEAGLARHNAFHAIKNDTETLLTWEVLTGEHTGMYFRGSFDHHWADFDQPFPEGDAEDSAANITPYIANTVTRVWGMMPEVSNPPAEAGPPSAMAQITEFHLRWGSVRQFQEAIAKVHEVATQTKWGEHYIWYTLMSGGMSPTLVLVIPADNWAGFVEPEVTFAEMMVGTLGPEGMQQLMDKFTSSVESEETYHIAYRPDLSYLPAAAGE
jgi:hypothetical protein